MRMRWNAKLTLALALLGSSCAARQSTSDLPRERIVYTTRRPVDGRLVLYERGASPRQLTGGPALDYDATFSGDGRWVVFCSERSGTPHLYALDISNSGAALPPKPLTRGRFMEAAPAFTPDGQSLVFVSDRAGNADIYTMPFRPNDPAAGDGAQDLTRNEACDCRPALSPDGMTIAFSSDRDTGRQYPFQAEIYVMNLDGSDVRRLTSTKAMNGSPAWSRDGRTLYFYSNQGSGSFRIWAMDANGAHPRAITPVELPALSPAVMPDKRIAFSAKEADGRHILSVAEDGSDVRLESGTLADCQGPAFDPRSGRMVCTARGTDSNAAPFLAAGAHAVVELPDRILDVQGVYPLFCSISPDGREFVTGQPLAAETPDAMHLVVNRLDGSEAREIFRPPQSAPVWATSWARRADLIAFAVGPQFAPDDAVVDIWTVHRDGTGAKNLTQGKFRNNTFPDLSADGSEIVFRSTRDGAKQIYSMNSDGTNVRKITTDPPDVNDTMPAISPNGDMIAYSSNFQIYVQALEHGERDGEPRRIQGDAPSVHSRFSPDGKWIVFVCRRAWLNDEGPLSNGNAQPYGEIFITPVDGESEPIRLTHDRWEDSVPCWGADPFSNVRD